MTAIKPLKCLFALLLIVTKGNAQSSNTDWQFVKEVKSIKVYHRKHVDNDIVEIKLVATLKKEKDEVTKYLLNSDNDKDWIYNVKEAYCIEKISENEKISYTYTYLPIFNNRDVVIKCNWWTDAATQKTTIYAKALTKTASESYKALRKDVVRVTILETTCILTKQGQETHFEYYALADPSGKIPIWLVNQFIDFGPIDSILALQANLSKK